MQVQQGIWKVPSGTELRWVRDGGSQPWLLILPSSGRGLKPRAAHGPTKPKLRRGAPSSQRVPGCVQFQQHPPWALARCKAPAMTVWRLRRPPPKTKTAWGALPSASLALFGILHEGSVVEGRGVLCGHSARTHTHTSTLRMGPDYIFPNKWLSRWLFMQLCIIDWCSPGCTPDGVWGGADGAGVCGVGWVRREGACWGPAG